MLLCKCVTQRTYCRWYFMKFNAHGDIGLIWNGNISIVYPSGGINIEGAKRLHLLVNEEIGNKQFEIFARIIVYHDEY
ncbi:hypothetical protein PSECIP111854_02215 [Pseudoalteromonas sp. CIP111854]|uniref:Uncharacterized protein n=2 Tax=Pseudoalteromonas holothuriae TaxID=2963714 RepID=A0A9W4QYF4_9GAMM|nr:hypothetical protein PSECIP111854_02215 [Pseudoalteromonas sp. CIP111854]